MNAVERVKSICKERKIPISKLEADCGFSNGYIGQLRKGTFPNDRLITISKYLNLSAEFLMTGKEVHAYELGTQDAILTSLDEKVIEYAIKLNNLPKDKQDHIMELIDLLYKMDK